MKNTQHKPIVVLKSIQYGNAFHSSTHKALDHDYTTLYDGTVAYEVLGFVDTSEEANALCAKVNGPFHLFDYIKKMSDDLNDKSGGELNVDAHEVFGLCRGKTDLARH